MALIILLSLHSTSNAQETLSIYVLPAYAPDLPGITGRKIAHEFSAHITTRDDFKACDPELVKTFEKTFSPKAVYSDDELMNIGRELRAEYLFLPTIEVTDSTHTFKVSLFDAVIGITTKVAVQNCECNFKEMSRFPFRRVAEVLFDAPELDLAAEAGEQPPPAMLPVMPALVPPPDSSAAQNTEKKPAAAPAKKRSWKKYIASAVVVSGGVLYLTVAKKSDNGGPREKLGDPPSPPGTN